VNNLYIKQYMNYGDHNFIEITQQTQLRVALVVSSQSNQSSSTCRACRAVLFDSVNTAKMHVVSCRVESSQVEFCLNRAEFVQPSTWLSNTPDMSLVDYKLSGVLR